jgi:hypothetical protein
MSIRRTGLLVLVILLQVPAAASATGHDADLSGGGGGAFGSKFWFVHSILAWPVPTKKHPERFSVVLSDFSYYNHAKKEGDNLFGYMAGGRLTFAMHTDQEKGHKRIELSPHALAGVTHTMGGGTAASFAFGGAMDVLLGPHLSSEHGWGVRVLYDYLVQKGDPHNMQRVSGEVVYQFKRTRHH